MKHSAIIAYMISKAEITKNTEYKIIAAAGDALGHPLRVAIFQFIYKENLARKKVCNKDITANFDYAQSTISQHINKLLHSDLVQSVSEGPANYYYVNLGMLGCFIDSVKKLNK